MSRWIAASIMIATACLALWSEFPWKRFFVTRGRVFPGWVGRVYSFALAAMLMVAAIFILTIAKS
jgi:hypothetical protein